MTTPDEITKALERVRRLHTKGYPLSGTSRDSCSECSDEWPCAAVVLADVLAADADELATWRRAGKLCVEILQGTDDDPASEKYHAKVWGGNMATPLSWWAENHDTPIAAVREALAKYDADMATVGT